MLNNFLQRLSQLWPDMNDIDREFIEGAVEYYRAYWRLPVGNAIDRLIQETELRPTMPPEAREELDVYDAKLKLDIRSCICIESRFLNIIWGRKMLRAKEIQNIKEILITMKKEILENLQERVKSSNINEQREIGDIFDDADLEQSRDFNLLLTTRERQKLQQIDAALKRMDEGEYGICEECGEDVPIGRLKAMPFTALCVKCKSKQERIAGHSVVSLKEKG